VGWDAWMDGRPLSHDSRSGHAHNRCDCPNHKVSNTTWPGTPALPGGLASNFGAALTGQFLVSRPAGGVAGEGPDLFPTASDYHLVCLQHDGAASLAVDGSNVYEGGLSAEAAAGKLFQCDDGGRSGSATCVHVRSHSSFHLILPPPLSFIVHRLQAVLRARHADTRLA